MKNIKGTRDATKGWDKEQNHGRFIFSFSRINGTVKTPYIGRRDQVGINIPAASPGVDGKEEGALIFTDLCVKKQTSFENAEMLASLLILK